MSVFFCFAKHIFFYIMTVKIFLSFSLSFCCCCCQDQKVFSLSPLSAPRNNCDSFSSVSVSSVKCLGKVRRQEIFTQAALFFWGVWVVHHFMRQLSVLGLFLHVFVLPGAETQSGNNTVKKKMLPQSVCFSYNLVNKAEPPCSDWKNKNMWFGWKKNEFLHPCLKK